MRRLLLFAHYFDTDGAIAPWAKRHLAALRPFVDRTVLLSTSALPAPAIWRAVADDALQLENLGFDFGMWQAGLKRESLAGFDELWLVNSSVVGPLSSLEVALQRVSNPALDFWSMTENLGPARHLQSWFLGVRRNAFESDAFRRFFDSILPFRDKWAVISASEISFTPWLSQHGFVGAAAWPYAEVIHRVPASVARLYPATNPTTTFATDLFALGMPYVKVDLLLGVTPPSASWTHRLLFPVHAARIRRALRARGIDPSTLLTET